MLLFRRSVMSDYLRPHGLQLTKLPCPSPSPGVCSNSFHWVSDATRPSRPLSSPSPPAFNLSQHQVFSNELAVCIKWPEYWSFSFSISPSNEYSGVISFRFDQFDLLAGQGTLKSLLQHHSSKASILWSSAFFMVQLSHPYMTTGKTIALIRRTFAGKVMSLIFNMLSRIFIAFLPKIKTDSKKVLNYWKPLLKLWLINNLDQRTWPSFLMWTLFS